MKCRFIEYLSINTIIAAVNNSNKLEKAIISNSKIIFLLVGNIFNLKEMIEKVKEKNKLVFIHFDLIEGFSRDTISMKYILKEMNPDSIISTKNHLIKYCDDKDVYSIQRIFLLNSLNLKSGIHSVKSNNPDAVEILPGIAQKAIRIVINVTKKPIITGGLIKTKEDIQNSLKAGAMGISTSKSELWNI